MANPFTLYAGTEQYPQDVYYQGRPLTAGEIVALLGTLPFTADGVPFS